LLFKEINMSDKMAEQAEPTNPRVYAIKSMFHAHQGLVKAWVNGVEFEKEAQEQVNNIALMPFVFPHVAVMPDVHAGKGATVGSVIPTLGAVIPAAVGVDIGCGMMAVKLPLKASDLPDSLVEMRSAIEKVVPHGRTNNGRAGDRGAWGEPPSIIAKNFEAALLMDYHEIVKKHGKLNHDQVANHMGTLGTGNHFLEVCLDEAQGVWVVLHSGSRGVGNKIGQYFIEKAKEDMRKYFINLPDQDLAYLPEGSEHFTDYCEAVQWAQRYAMMNREMMMIQALQAIAPLVGEKIMRPYSVLDLAAGYEQFVACHHNYVTREAHGGKNVLITRKGAVCARKGVMGIIPGSMGARTYIVRGKGNKDSLDSCSHGAGRRMSRTQARKQFTVEDHIKATEGVECRKDEDVIDETPGAYKDIDAVMEAQKDLVEIVHTLKAVLCIKG
jgi:tRNA-splicing ligase RtcB